MNVELRKIKMGGVGRNGCKMTSGELYIDGKHVARCVDEANGGCLSVHPFGVEEMDKLHEFKAYLATKTSNWDANDKMDIDEWFATICDELEVMKSLKRKTKSAIVFYNKNTEEIVTVKLKVPVAEYLKKPELIDILKKALASRRKYYDEGFVLVNEELKSLA